MTDETKVHPFRRKHRRGKRGGKKHRKLAPLAVVAPPTPAALLNLRSRLSLLARKAG